MIDTLTKLYEQFNKEHGLDLGSADEHLFDENLTQDQRDWLSAFCDLWANTESMWVRKATTFHLKSIVWDTDDETVDLPLSTTIQAKDEGSIADALSDRYGFCVKEFESA